MKYLLILLSSFIVFAANAAPPPKDVNVVSMPSVTIDNLDPIPVEVTNNANGGELVNISLAGRFGSGDDSMSPRGGTAPPDQYQVPNGKILIVRHVACDAVVNTGGMVSLAFITTVTNTTDVNAIKASTATGGYYVMLNKRYSYGALDFYAANHAMFVVVGGSTSNGSLQLGGERSITSGSSNVDCLLTGELMDE